MFRILRKLILFSLLLVTLIALFIYQSTVIPLQDTLLSRDTNAADVAQCVTHSSTSPLDRHGNLNIATWNIYKHQNDGWQNVLKQLADRTDLLLLQEATLSDDLKSLVNELKEDWVLARAFTFGGEAVGVMNLSKDYPLSTCAFRHAEPLIYYPKSLLVSYYKLSDSSQLLVVNIHSINFTLGLQDYQAQLNVVAAAMLEHHGPIIFAGDLNTWSDDREKYVLTMVQKAGLIEAVPRDDSRTTVFSHSVDHIFYRDLELVNTESIVTDSSDHNPLKAYFRLLKKIP
ncbi:endonuclease/exonuclease/phosphatase family protein [Shewanella abyssi]|uniref:endonuclease/exonuclease/phosphatase family protein n=1 Tax=Shewanella abyssi TaxID=311789 RepID=UPI0020100A0B|nr:endonuclease/exonuclease/phosphatase family protein [Shewanella abyssi]MCL1048255.1 endonuclease/exonuclease/phosphatase family protein [Shewanella abyssi]